MKGRSLSVLDTQSCIYTLCAFIVIARVCNVCGLASRSGASGASLPLAATKMADLADELLRDLEGDDSGDDGGYVDEEQEYAQAQAQARANGSENGAMSTTLLGKRKASEGDEDGGEDAMDGDEEMPRVKEEERDVALPEGGIRPAEELDADDVAQMQLKDVKDVSSVARLAGSKHFREVIQVGQPSLAVLLKGCLGQ